MTDQQAAADRVRAKLEKRLAALLGVEASSLPPMRLGVLVNVLFAMVGDSHEVGSYFATCEGLSKVLGRDLLWDEPDKPKEVEEQPKVVVN